MYEYLCVVDKCEMGEECFVLCHNYMSEVLMNNLPCATDVINILEKKKYAYTCVCEHVCYIVKIWKWQNKIWTKLIKLK